MLARQHVFLLQSSPALSAEAMELRKMVMNHSNEYWYMGSMLERSVVQKKRSCVRLATGMYLLRVWSISSSVFSASATLACIIISTLTLHLLQAHDVALGNLLCVPDC